MNSIEIKNLKKYYNKGKIKAVDGISLNVPKGARFGFLGPNGAGKTTTIRCILGFLNPDSGTTLINGEEINPKKDVNIRNHIGYLPGELGLYKYMTAAQLIKYFAKLFDIEMDWKFIKDVTERLEIEMDRKMGVLSKGNKQKVGVLTALMGKFDILIMDEPTSGLDPLMQSEFYRIISERQNDSNCTVFVSSHVLPEIEKFCDQVAIIKNGKIIEVSSVQELKKKSLKRIELDFENNKSLIEFNSFLSSDFPEAIVKQKYQKKIEFLLPFNQSRDMLAHLSKNKWAGMPVKDFDITHSTLDNIFLEYYKDSNLKGGKAV
ncbi:MAG: ABC transporter ATP-binding protein [Promethearchaeota archaeon]